MMRLPILFAPRPRRYAVRIIGQNSFIARGTMDDQRKAAAQPPAALPLSPSTAGTTR